MHEHLIASRPIGMPYTPMPGVLRATISATERNFSYFPQRTIEEYNYSGKRPSIMVLGLAWPFYPWFASEGNANLFSLEARPDAYKLERRWEVEVLMTLYGINNSNGGRDNTTAGEVGSSLRQSLSMNIATFLPTTNGLSSRPSQFAAQLWTARVRNAPILA